MYKTFIEPFVFFVCNFGSQIHSDVNDYNIIVNEATESVVGFIGRVHTHYSQHSSALTFDANDHLDTW